MFDIISNENPVQLENNELKTITKDIYRSGVTIRKNFYKIAHLLYRVENERLFVDDGFMSAADYVMQTFGFKKTLAYNLIAIGETYTDENGQESNLLHDKTKDYTSSQLAVMLPHSEDTIRELTEAEEITPYMTVSAIKKRLKQEGQEEQEEQEQEEQEEQEQEEQENCPEPDYIFEIKAYYDETGEVVFSTNGEIPEDFANTINSYFKE